MVDLFESLPESAGNAYVNMRSEASNEARLCREFCKSLWGRFESHADPGFIQDFPTHTHQRFWEMYVAVAMIDAGHRIEAPKPGPDIGLIHRGKQVWIEAVAASPGDPAKPDSVPPYEPSEGTPRVKNVPTDRIILRCTAAISAKFPAQYQQHVKLGVIRPNDCYVVAVNIAQADYWTDQGMPPYILRAVLGVHHPFVTLDKFSGDIVGTGIQYRGQVPKQRGAPVDANLFLEEESFGVSGVICSVVNTSTPVNLKHSERRMGQDFMLVGNPMARTPLPPGLLVRGTEFRVSIEDDHFEVSEKRVRWPCGRLLLRKFGF